MTAMTQISIDCLVRAREAAESLLEQLGLANYLYKIDPSDEGWRLRVDFELEGCWKSVTVMLDAERLLASTTDPRISRQMLAELRRLLGVRRLVGK